MLCRSLFCGAGLLPVGDSFLSGGECCAVMLSDCQGDDLVGWMALHSRRMLQQLTEAQMLQFAAEQEIEVPEGTLKPALAELLIEALELEVLWAVEERDRNLQAEREERHKNLSAQLELARLKANRGGGPLEPRFDVRSALPLMPVFLEEDVDTLFEAFEVVAREGDWPEAKGPPLVRERPEVVTGEMTVGVVPTLPVPGTSLLLGKDLAGFQVGVTPVVVFTPLEVPEAPPLGRERPEGVIQTQRAEAHAAPVLPLVEERPGVSPSAEEEDLVSLADTVFAQAVGCEHLCSVKEDPYPSLAPVRDTTISRERLVNEGRVIAEGVGPLPRTRKEPDYLVTSEDVAKRFPEAVPIHNIWAPMIRESRLQSFSLVGLPKEVQADRATRFTSGVFQKVMCELGITQVLSSAYHPELQGARERGHPTLPMQIFGVECPKDWDVAMLCLLSARRDVLNVGGAYCAMVWAYPALFRDPVVMPIDDGG